MEMNNQMEPHFNKDINSKKENQEELGLKLSNQIHNEYGDAFLNNQKDRVSGYASFIRCCGIIPKVACCICAPCGHGPVRIIPTGYIGLLSEFGKVVAKLEPGMHTVNSCSQQLIIVSLKTQVIDIPVQELLTKDNVTITIDAYVAYKVRCPELAYYKVENVMRLIGLMTQGVLKAVVAERNLTDLLTSRDEVEEAITKTIDKETDPYGIDVQTIEMKSISLPEKMQHAMATVAESKKEAEAKVVDAQGNLQSAKIYKQAADQLSKEPLSIYLQYFDLMKSVAAKHNHDTMIIPSTVLEALKQK